MNWDNIVAIVSLVISGIAIFSSFRKSQSEVYNLDAKTLKEYQDAIKEGHNNYQQLLDEMEGLRCKFDEQDIYIRALIRQLRNANIIPISKTEALKNRNGV